MGCSASKPNIINTMSLEEHNPSSTSPYYSSPMQNTNRALSLHTPLVHHPPSRKGDSDHLVSLTSTTYGSLLLIEPFHPKQSEDHTLLPQEPSKNSEKPESKTDPCLNEEYLSPDSVINTWELMDGLDDDDEDGENSVSGFQKIQSLQSRSSLSDHSIDKGSSFASVYKAKQDSFDSSSKPEEIEAETKKPVAMPKPLWKHLSEESTLSNMDPNVVSSYIHALSSKQLDHSNNASKTTNSLSPSPVYGSFPAKDGIFLLGSEQKIVMYLTSLRGIRKTFENCNAVRMIFRGFRVPVDERDISMDSNHRKELQNVLQGRAISLPQVFIRGKYIGGVEEIKQLNEFGELVKLLKGFPVIDPGLVCDGCGDARFVPCLNCSGSRKVFDANEDRLRRCPDCNENGLIRCPGCCS